MAKTRKRRRRFGRFALFGGFLFFLLFSVCCVGSILSSDTDDSDSVLPTATRKRVTPRPTPTPHIAHLYCPDCRDIGMWINLWQRGQADRGRVVAEAPHGTEVIILERRSEPSEDRDYLKVKIMATGQTGWVPEPFVR